MRVLITGATGFVGRHIVQSVLREGHAVTCLARRLPEDVDSFGEVTWAIGDVTRLELLNDSFEGQDAVIHLVGIIEEKRSSSVTFERVHTEGTRNIVRKSLDAGVRIFLQMSANGARENKISRYQTSKWRAEQLVQEAGFHHYTIFRPTLIFGRPAPGTPEFASRIVSDLLRPLPVWPIFGDGKYEMQPVHVQNVADGFARALTVPSAQNQIYCASGNERIPYRELLDLLARAAGIRKKSSVSVPVGLASPGVRLFGGWLLPITHDQLVMLVEGNTCDPSSFIRDLSIELIPFTEENLTYLNAQDSG